MSKKTNFGKINGREAMVVGIIIVMVALFRRPFQVLCKR